MEKVLPVHNPLKVYINIMFFKSNLYLVKQENHLVLKTVVLFFLTQILCILKSTSYAEFFVKASKAVWAYRDNVPKVEKFECGEVGANFLFFSPATPQNLSIKYNALH